MKFCKSQQVVLFTTTDDYGFTYLLKVLYNDRVGKSRHVCSNLTTFAAVHLRLTHLKSKLK